MDKQTARKVLENPEFQKMARQKSFFGWTFSAITLLLYFSYIWVIGNNPDALRVPVSEGALTTWGIYAGGFMIFFSFAITGIYVKIANGKFEKMTQDVVKSVRENS